MILFLPLPKSQLLVPAVVLSCRKRSTQTYYRHYWLATNQRGCIRLLSAPIELIKIRQQNMLESGLGSVSTRNLVSTICREHGLKGLYRGFTATALRDSGYGAYFLGVRPSPS
jgi:hypothetical protein